VLDFLGQHGRTLDAGGTTRFFDVVLKRDRKTEVIEECRTQALHDLPRRSYRTVDGVVEPRETLAQIVGLPGSIFQKREVHARCRQHAAHLVVQLALNGTPFGFVAPLQVEHQFGCA
jgi:hypothetical protein